MKKKILALLLVVLLVGGLTACGKSEESLNVGDELNKLMDSLESETDNFHVKTVQDYLEKNSDYRLIDGGNKEISEKPSDSKNKYTFVQQNEQLINTSNYVLIYNVKTDKYYSIPVGAVGYKPYFNEAVELK